MAASAHRPELVEVKASEMKRPKTAWGLFLEEYKKNRSNVGGIEKFNELQKAASAQWKRMTPEEKEVSFLHCKNDISIFNIFPLVDVVAMD